LENRFGEADRVEIGRIEVSRMFIEIVFLQLVNAAQVELYLADEVGTVDAEQDVAIS